MTGNDIEVRYTVEVTFRSVEEAHMRSLLLHSLSQTGLGLRRIDSEDIPDASEVVLTATVVSGKRNDAALEQAVGRLSPEPTVSAANWRVHPMIYEA